MSTPESALGNAREATREVEAVLKRYYPDGTEALVFMAATVTAFAKFYGATKEDFLGLMVRIYDETRA